MDTAAAGSRVSLGVQSMVYMTVFYGFFVHRLFVLACYDFSVQNIGVATVSNPRLAYKHLLVFREKATRQRDFEQAGGFG